MRSQPFADASKAQHLVARKMMEINRRHSSTSSTRSSPTRRQNTDLAEPALRRRAHQFGLLTRRHEFLLVTPLPPQQLSLNLETLDSDQKPEIEVPADAEGEGEDGEEEDDLDAAFGGDSEEL